MRFESRQRTSKPQQAGLTLIFVVLAFMLSSILSLTACSSVQNPTSRDDQKKEPAKTPETDNNDESAASADQPAMITGSWLTCGPTNSGVADEYGCYYTDEEGKKVDAENAKWTVTIVGEDGKTYEVRDLSDAPPGSPWHVVFTIPPELEGTSFEIKGEVTLDGTPTTAECPQGYILVPGDAFYKTSDFCVMKYEAKQKTVDGATVVYSDVGGMFVRNPTFPAAKTACQNLGEKFALMTNDEWMTIAVNIAGNKDNWSGNAVGSVAINRGHSDGLPQIARLNAELDEHPCFGTMNENCLDRSHQDWLQKRTHTLSNGQVIWDLAGNSKEWTDLGAPRKDLLLPNTPGRLEYSLLVSDTSDMKVTDLRPTSASHSWWNDSWNSAQGIGKYATLVQNSRAALRGGIYDNQEFAGILTFWMATDDFTDETVDFRCVYHK